MPGNTFSLLFSDIFCVTGYAHSWLISVENCHRLRAFFLPHVEPLKETLLCPLETVNRVIFPYPKSGFVSSIFARK